MPGRKYKRGRFYYELKNYPDCPTCGRAMLLLPKSDLSGKELICSSYQCPSKKIG
jgi:hypothetical protein